MPIHDWTRVDAGIFHDFHHAWIEEIKRALNSRLPNDYYALAEQHAAGFGPDVLTLQGSGGANANGSHQAADSSASNAGITLLLDPPKVRIQAETELQFYGRKQKLIAVRHVTGDEIVAVVEIVSPGNKAGRHAFQAFLDKAGEFIERNIHLLIVDVFPPTNRDPQGIHAAIWEGITDEPSTPTADKPLTLVAYESALTVKAYIEPVAVGDVLPDMPLFLKPGAHVLVPLETTYEAAWNAVPRRWRSVLDPAAK